MQKINNLKYYTNTEIGFEHDINVAIRQVLNELKAAVESTPGLSMASSDTEGKEVPF